MSEAAEPTPESRPASRGFEARPWGGFETLHEGPGFKVKRLFVEPGRRLSLQRHRFRAESWIVVSGWPRLIIAGQARRLRPRQMVSVPRGAWHRIENPGKEPVTIIEVQHGPYLGEDDIIRRHDDYGRADGRPVGLPPAGGGAFSEARQSPSPRSAPIRAARSRAKTLRPGGSAS
jgi:mannose-6-phosphate isomerase-like protein (cupin superfamily)